MTRPKHPPRNTWPKGYICITDVAGIVGYSYQVSRDLVLRGRCGPVKMVGVTRLVLRSNVMKLKAEIEKMNLPQVTRVPAPLNKVQSATNTRRKADRRGA